MLIVISEFMDPAAVEALASEFAVTHQPALVDDLERLAEAVSTADALIVRNRTQVNAHLLSCARQLRVVGRLGVGLDNIDTAACAVRSIEVIAATGANAVAVAEYVITTASMLLRGAYASSLDIAAGRWLRAELSRGRELHGNTLGLIGFGSIGRVTARLGRAMGMRAVAHDPLLAADDAAWSSDDVARRSLDELLSEADVISLHVPLVAGTRGLLDGARIAAIKRGAVIINSSRGGIIDEAALAAALQRGHLAGAALDVFEHEPLSSGTVLAQCPNLILTPHIAGVTQESNVRVSALIADRVAASLRASAAHDR